MTVAEDTQFEDEKIIDDWLLLADWLSSIMKQMGHKKFLTKLVRP